MVIRDFGHAGDHHLALKMQEIIAAINSGGDGGNGIVVVSTTIAI